MTLTPEEIERQRNEWAFWHVGCALDSLRYAREVWGAGPWEAELRDLDRRIRKATRQYQNARQRRTSSPLPP